MLKTALVPLSLRESRAALSALARELKIMGTRELTLLHIASSPASSTEALSSKIQDRAAIFEEEGLIVETVLRKGSPALELTRTARDLGTDYIAFSWKRKSWLQRTLIGSTTQDSIRLSDRPVYIRKGAVRGPAASLRGGAGSGQAAHEDSLVVVYATDFGATDAAVMPFLHRPNIPIDRLVLLHVGPRAPDPMAESRRLAAAEANLKRLASECNVPAVATRNVAGAPKQKIAREAARLGARLVVLGKRDAPGRFAGVLGSTAGALAFQSRASVLIVPPPSSRRAADEKSQEQHS
ncbi:MAG: universal stress protein [Spirochaetaceae bacterium]|nr:MAG: universal stress protein [Spirochaetaceae bacterium]